MYMHFAEVEDLKGQIREFTISVNNESYGGPVAPRYLFSDTVYSKYSMNGSTTKELFISLTRTNRSTLPPIINALEVYRLQELSQLSTQQNDGRFCTYIYIYMCVCVCVCVCSYIWILSSLNMIIQFYLIHFFFLFWKITS